MSMWFYIIMVSITVLSLGIIASIVLKKFPQLSLIDAESLPKEREAKKKKDIIRSRLGRRVGDRFSWIMRKLSPVVDFLGKKFQVAYEAVAKIDNRFWGRATALIHPEERRLTAKKFVAEAHKLVEQNKVAEAEKKYIEAVSMDKNCRTAYRGLGELYMNSKNYERAKDIYEYLARTSVRDCCVQNKNNPLNSHEASEKEQVNIAKDHLDLATAYKALNDIIGWRSALETVVEHEPANPKHLDFLLEAYVAEGNQEKASKILRLLEEVNPENHKLPKLKEQVAKMNMTADKYGN